MPCQKFVVFLAFAVSSCGGSNPSVSSLNPLQQARFRQMEVFPGPPPRAHDVLGAVEGVSCDDSAAKLYITSDEAMEGAKVRAAKLGADAVAFAACKKNREVDWGRNCWQTIICTGYAIKFK
jgi:hypothetical protein